jgi:hypothetical protein
MHPSIEYENFLGYPNKIDIRWLEDCPKFKGLAIDHVAKFVKHIWDLGVDHEDVQIKLFICFWFDYLQNWVADQEGISSCAYLINRFLELWAPQSHTYEDILRELTMAFILEGFSPNINIEELRGTHHAREKKSVKNAHPHEDEALIITPLVGENELIEGHDFLEEVTFEEDEEFIGKEPPCLEHALNEEDCTSPKKDLVAVLIHTCKRELSPAHLVCPWRHNA